MLLKNISNTYNLLLSLGAFYLSILMFLGNGDFDTFPQEWIGVLPFNNWSTLGLFGFIVFGIGNGIASIYGFIKNNRKIFVITLIMGALLLIFTVVATILVGEWYLPTSQLVILSVIQILISFIGLFIKKS